MKKIRILLLISGILIVLVILKFTWLKKDNASGNGKSGSSRNTTTLAVSVTVLHPEKSEQQLFAAGTLRAIESVELHPEMPGKIVSLNIPEGSTVSKGQLLVKLNDADLQAQLKKLQLQEQLAVEKEKRMKTLLNANGISREEYESSLNELNNISADIEFTIVQISKTEIRAPFNGVAGLRWVSEGSYVNPSSRITTISQVDPVMIEFSVPERYASHLKKNNAIRFTVEGRREETEARISVIETGVDVASRTLRARAVCPNKKELLFPGAFAKISLLMNESDSTLFVPAQALVPVLKGYKVFVLKNGIVDETPVFTGLRTENKVEVLQGLSPGDTLITSGTMQLKKGMPVTVKELK